MAKNDSAQYNGDAIASHDDIEVDLPRDQKQWQEQQFQKAQLADQHSNNHNEEQHKKMLVQQHQQHHDNKSTQGIILLFLSAFLFSLMGMFLQFTGRMGIPSTELVFIRAVFQGTFVISGMIIFRVENNDDDVSDGSPSDRKEILNDVEIGNGNSNDNNDDNFLEEEEEGVRMVPILHRHEHSVHEQLSNEEKKVENITTDGDEDTISMSPMENCAKEKVALLATSSGSTYGTLSTPNNEVPSKSALKSSSSSNNSKLPPRIIYRPFGTSPTMIHVVLLRGIIGGFGFLNYYYTLSTLPLGDATTLLSLYPIVTIFVARIVLGEEIKTLNIVAAVLSIVGAALISRPSFLFGNDHEEEIESLTNRRPPKLGYITAIIGSLCASGVIVLIRKAGKVGAHTLQLLFSWTVFGVSFSVLVGCITSSISPNEQWRIPSREELPSVLCVCLSGTMAHFLLNYAAKLVPATLGGLLRSSDIFWAYMLEILVLTEHPPKATWCGVVFVCSSLVLVLVTSNKKVIGKMTKHYLGSIGNLTAAK
mmetsp:Transcript_8103/g.14203  ORF Transcript_8103/g.14203 Transcript_8103/m.14203 type:complete len:535 (-) Transcript_8103:83-1687(-)